MGILVAILGLGLIIYVHELGHFISGKVLRLKITEFFLGLPFGRPLIRVKRGETEYGIRPVLFGGYVKFPEFMSLADKVVDTVAPGSSAFQAGIQVGDEIIAVDGRSVDTWTDISGAVIDRPGQSVDITVRREEEEIVLTAQLGERDGRGLLGAGPTTMDNITVDDLPDTLDGQSMWRKTLVTAAGPLMNILLAIVILAGALMVGFAEPTNTVARVIPASPAAKAGIKANDTVVSIAGARTKDWSGVTKEINENAGKRVTIVLRRGSKNITTEAVLRAKSDKGLLGVVTKLVRRPRGPVEAVRESFGFAYQATGMILTVMAKLVTAPTSIVGQLRSPIGVVQETAPIAQRDMLEYLVTLAGISIAIGIFNILPIPPLDGGRILISAIEALSRRRLRKESLIFVNAVGVSLLLALMTYVIVADIFRMASFK